MICGELKPWDIIAPMHDLHKGARNNSGEPNGADRHQLLGHFTFNICQCSLRSLCKRAANTDCLMSSLQSFCITRLVGQGLRKVIQCGDRVGMILRSLAKGGLGPGQVMHPVGDIADAYLRREILRPAI